MAGPKRLGSPPMRADARRNHDALVAVAGEVFAELGPEAPLDLIARRAGVGNATLYRHFPTRHDLLVAVAVDDVEALRALADRLGSGGEDSRAALIEWLRAYVDHVGSRSGLAAALDTGRRDDSAMITAAHEAVGAAGNALLDAAKTAGAVRADLLIADLLALVNAIATAAESGDRQRTDRLLRLVLEGIAPR